MCIRDRVLPGSCNQAGDIDKEFLGDVDALDLLSQGCDLIQRYNRPHAVHCPGAAGLLQDADLIF